MEAGFFLAPDFAGNGAAFRGALASGVGAAGTVLFWAEGRMDEEILFDGLLLRDEGFAIA